jgi:hypothetical protein
MEYKIINIAGPQFKWFFFVTFTNHQMRNRYSQINLLLKKASLISRKKYLNHYRCWRSFSATGSSGSSFTNSTVFPFLSAGFTAGFLGAFSAGGFASGA